MYTAENTATGVACTYLSKILTETPEDKTGVIKVVAKLENGNESTYDEVEYIVNTATDEIITPEMIRDSL